VSLVAGVGGPLLLFSLVRSNGPTRASSLLFAVPAITSIAAWPILGTHLGALTVVGLGVVGIAFRLGRPGPPVRAVRVQRCSQRSDPGRMRA
jgi:drug/metabolite transporter (DMT)-like permease